ncbi:trans-2-enoyl-CoA reductase family protein [Alicyclobacillaceae bacterium I2511]|nr:trans-2-enoyl-CoA reductase family protein [Alicyclobacillaceae bacterium I2511]
MIIQPKIRGFICTTAHPLGCALQVQRQIEYAREQSAIQGPKKVLVIGSSTGYGLASRIISTFAAGADTLGIFFEKSATDKRTATAGWYNTAAFQQAAHAVGRTALNINGDAFSDAVKEQAIDMIRKHFGSVDLIIYSLASPRRTHPRTGESLFSVIKPVGKSFTSQTIDVNTGTLSQVTLEPANDEEIRQTVGVMGGEDWELWINALNDAGVLAKNATTVAYSYIGPAITFPMYREGTIGKAKDDLEATAIRLNASLQKTGGRAFVSINKAVVTQSSSAIPVVPLYISILYKIMQEKGIHEGCIEQIYRLFAKRLYTGDTVPVDEKGRIRIDDYEMRPDVQTEVLNAWNHMNQENLTLLANLEEYQQEFLSLFGFSNEKIHYAEEVNPVVAVNPS